MSDDIYWLGFSAFPGVGPARFQTLLSYFGSAENAWKADEREFAEAMGQALTEKFLYFKKEFSPERYAERLEKRQIHSLLLRDSRYPKLLKKLPTAPIVLYIKGDSDVVSLSEKTIAVVGTRKYTPYGKEVTELLTEQLVANNFVIVSGLAIGVDSIAHQATITANGKTIAVLGCGVDCCTPTTNLPLYDKIVRQYGAVVSESAFGGAASKGMFPARNRIIAGLSLGVVVTEGAEDSGALITAQRAKELERPVFAVPGPITSQLSVGPNKLLQQGAKTITNASDIMAAFGISGRTISQKQIPIGTNDLEQAIIDLLIQENIGIDHMVRVTHQATSIISATVSMMEVKGMVRYLSDGKYTLA